MSSTELRKTGIGVVGDVPWGTHFFLFHETREDLLDTLVPYFKAGLEGKELCIWVISNPLTEHEAQTSLKKEVRSFEAYLEQRRMRFVQGRGWYMTGDDLELEKVPDGWNQSRDCA